jgi:2-succinyl-5-enolpyruvyl-6-hydroxy-3-cyclohexene-1-carboxylate synthase
VAAGLLEPFGLRLHTTIDERSAAFFALGLARATGLPAAVITTSGTAVANLLPAAVEADHGTIPLLLLTADRPARLKGCGANQSVNQEQFLSCSCRWLGEGPPDGLARLATADLERLAARAMAAACGDGHSMPPGPVHLNLAFDDPLHAEGPALLALAEWLRAEGVRLEGAHRPRREESASHSAVAVDLPFSFPLDPCRPGVVVAGPWRGDPAGWGAHVEAVRRWQRLSGWPVLADALSGLRGLPDLELVAGYDLLLENPAEDLAAPQVLRLGPLPASRRLERWLQGLEAVQVLVSETDPRPLDPLGVVRQQSSAGLAAWLEQLPHGQGCDPSPEPSQTSLVLARRWHGAEKRLQNWLAAQLAPQPADSGALDAAAAAISEPWLARCLARLLPQGLPVMLASSSPVRDWECFADGAAPPRPLFAFRGASGIDGTLSLACGLAEGLGHLVLVTGDLALLHDSNGWLWHRQLDGRLTVVLIDNGGGGIFEQLPIRTVPEEAMDFERLFAMPQGPDPRALAAVHGVPSRLLSHPADLAGNLVWALEQPISLLVARTDRRRDAALRRRLRTMASRALASP